MNLDKILNLGYDFDMIPEKFRLKKRSAFNATYKTGTFFHKDGITLFCGKKKTYDSSTRIGFVASKKIHKRAVKRNRIKRLMRESTRLYIKNSGGDFNSPYISLIFVASSKLLEKNYKEIETGINNLMSMVKND